MVTKCRIAIVENHQGRIYSGKRVRELHISKLWHSKIIARWWSTFYSYSLLFNTSHGILIREKWDFPPNPFIPAWSLSKSLLCLLLHPGLKPFLFTWKQWWCHCYINRWLLCSVFQPGLWVNGMACLVIQTCFWKKFGMSPNTTWHELKWRKYRLVPFAWSDGGHNEENLCLVGWMSRALANSLASMMRQET